MKILLLGNNGQVGWELHRTLHTLCNLTALDYPNIDMADPGTIRLVVNQTKPDIIVNATAFTDVDRAESEPELAMLINGTGVGILAEEAKKNNAALIHYSTDYVFDGTKGEPYTEKDSPNPLSIYGKSKLAGEHYVQEIDGVYLIFRTSWVYSNRRPCFVTKVLEWARKHETLRIVDDQISSPTWARTLAEATAQVISQGPQHPVHHIRTTQGIYNLAGNGSCSRYDWAKAIIEWDPDKKEQLVENILPASSEEFPAPAHRPEYSALSNRKLIETFGLNCSPWEQALRLMFAR